MTSDMKQSFLNAVRAKLKEAEEKFGVDMKDVKIELNIRGWRAAGYAQWCPAKGYRLRFHPEYIATHFDEMVNVTVPHEVAHMVCFKKESLGRDHNRGWQMVDRMLGGNGKRCHKMKAAMKAAKAKSPRRAPRSVYIYHTTRGYEIAVGKVRHERIQSGVVYEARNQGRILKHGFQRIKQMR